MEKKIKEIRGIFEFWGDVSGLPASPKAFRGEVVLENGEVITDKEINENEQLFYYIAQIIPYSKIEVVY